MLMRWSLSRVTRAVFPSGSKTTELGPDFSPPTVTLPAGVTVVPAMVKTDTVPSSRLATNASVPALLMETPAAPLPACRVASTLGAVAAPLPTPTTDLTRVTRVGFSDARSMTVSLSSAMVLLGSAGSIFWLAVTRAISSRGDTATLSGGPTTLLGTSISASNFGGLARKSMIDTVSGAGSFCTTTLPSTSFTLLSLADTAICAETTPAAATDIAPARTTHRHMLASPNFWRRNLSTGRAWQPRGELGPSPARLPEPRAMTRPPFHAMSWTEERPELRFDVHQTDGEGGDRRRGEPSDAQDGASNRRGAPAAECGERRLGRRLRAFDPGQPGVEG